MAEETQVATEATPQMSTPLPEEATNHFRASFFGETEPAKTEVEKPQNATEQPATQQSSEITQTKKEEEEEILDPKDWLKREFEVEDPEILKQQIKEYRELKSKTQEEIKFENEESKQLHELIRSGKTKEVKEFLETREKLSELVSSEVNEDVAESIIKLSMKLKNKDLTDKEIEFKYNKMYRIPKEPVKGYLEDDDDFEQRKSNWEQQVADIKMSKIIDAKTAKPELESYNQKLVLPQIEKQQTAAKEPTPEELESLNAAKQSFQQAVKKSLEEFNGFDVNVQDKDVKYNAGYTLSTEEKTFVSDELSKFVEAGFDANSLFADRWVSEDGKSINTAQMIKDLSLLYNQDKVTNKIATDAANKRLEAYLAEKKNVSIKESNHGSTFQPQQTKNTSEKLQEQFWG